MAEQNPRLEMFRMWKGETKGKQKTKLIKALRRIKRRDVARFVSEYHERKIKSREGGTRKIAIA